MALLPEVSAPAATAPFAIRHPTENSTVELPERRTDAALFPESTDNLFEPWWTVGFRSAWESRNVASVKLLLDLALINGLE
jgi:hypothetical protein